MLIPAEHKYDLMVQEIADGGGGEQRVMAPAGRGCSNGTAAAADAPRSSQRRAWRAAARVPFCITTA